MVEACGSCGGGIVEAYGSCYRGTVDVIVDVIVDG